MRVVLSTYGSRATSNRRRPRCPAHRARRRGPGVRTTGRGLRSPAGRGRGGPNACVALGASADDGEAGAGVAPSTSNRIRRRPVRSGHRGGPGNRPLVATGMLPAPAGACQSPRSRPADGIGELPAARGAVAYHRPLEYPGRPFPPDVTDYRALWDLDTAATDALFRDALNINRASAGLPAVPHVRDYVVGDRPWVARDPVLDPLLERPDLDVVQPGRGCYLTTGHCPPRCAPSSTTVRHRSTSASAACRCTIRRTLPATWSKRFDQRAAVSCSCRGGGPTSPPTTPPAPSTPKRMSWSSARSTTRHCSLG